MHHSVICSRLAQYINTLAPEYYVQIQDSGYSIVIFLIYRKCNQWYLKGHKKAILIFFSIG